VRERLVQYFNNEGILDWQYDRIAKGLYWYVFQIMLNIQNFSVDV
jgi:hypothetical protein